MVTRLRSMAATFVAHGCITSEMPVRTSPRYVSVICMTACLGLSMAVPVGQQQTLKAGVPVITDHLKVRIFPDEATAIPGGRVALGVEIEPRPRMHVYAPGAENYQIISLTIGGPPFVRALPLLYPPSEIYFFEPFKERVPVYQKPFKLTREIVFENKAGAETAFLENRKLTLKGKLDYQACDDKVCFMPVSVPLSWSVQLRGHDSAK